MTILNSLNSPLRIDALQVAPGQGWLGMTLCPGKQQANSMSGGDWQRDLNLDLDAVKTWGASTVLTLLEEHEFPAFGVTGLPSAVRERGMRWIHLPIPDRCAPTATFEAAWPQLAPDLHQRLDDGERLLIHCLGGIGRTGTVAARLLMERGWSCADAMLEVRKVRRGAIETAVQEDYLQTLQIL